MNRLFTESLISNEKQNFIKNTLTECKTGVDRIVAPLLDKDGVVITRQAQVMSMKMVFLQLTMM